MRRSRLAGKVAWPGVAALLLLALLSWRVLTLGLADLLARKDPDAALSWRGEHPEALFRAAEKLVAEGAEPGRADRLARAAIQANPLDGRPWRLLGQLAEAGGDVRLAHRHYSRALARSPRDLPSHAWMFEHEIRAGRIAAALRHADLLLRLQPELADRIFPLLIGLAREPAALPAMARLLAEAPPWRARFVATLLADGDPAIPLAGLLGEAALAGDGLAKAEWPTWLDRLSASGDAGVAYAYWASRRPAGQALPYLANGGFESEPDGTGFDWRFEHLPGASIELLNEPGVVGRQALSVGFDRQRVPFRHVRQRLLLPPGRYLLEGQQRADALENDRGLAWVVACAEAGPVLGSTPGLKGTTPWLPFSLAFEVPEGCGQQWLELSLQAPAGIGQMAAGRAWFDEMRIARL